MGLDGMACEPTPSLSDGESSSNLGANSDGNETHGGCRYRTECTLVIMRQRAYFGALNL